MNQALMEPVDTPSSGHEIVVVQATGSVALLY